jgi:hypothetical protein
MAWRRPKPPKSTPEPVARAAVEADRARGLTAATATVELGRESAWASWKFANREWQIEAWRLYDIVPELRFLAGWIGDSVSQCRLYVTRIDETGEETGEVEDRRISEIGAQPLGSGSQRDDNLRLLGVDLAVGGEAWVVGEGALTDDPKNWFVISGSQIHRNGDLISIRRPLSAGGKVLVLTDGEDVLIRAWRPHPNDIWQSDSPTRSAIPALREIELLTKREFAELESRLVGAGVWFLPEGIDFPRGEGDPEGMTGAMAMLQRAAAENIREQSRASSMVPIIATIPDNLLEHLEKFKDPSRFWSQLSEQILPMKEKAIIRVAASFEIPSELLTGLGNSNHWSAWAVSEEGIKRCRPYLATIADTLTRGFLVPALERAGYADAEQYAYAFDVAPLSVRPNRLPEALELWDRFLITDDEAVRAGAFSEEDMPTEQEKLKSLLFRSVVKDPALLADPGVQAALGMYAPIAIGTPVPTPAIEEAPTEDDSEAPAQSPPSEPASEPVGESPPGTSARGSVQELAALITRDTAPLTAACEMAVLRALEIAGARLATHADRRGRYAGTPKHMLHVRVGGAQWQQADKVLDGALEHVPILAERLGVDERQLSATLHRYCSDLIQHGMAHSEDLLTEALREVTGDD